MNPTSLEKLSLTGKVAVITGGTQGLGEGIAHVFADRGAAGLVICGRNQANGERVKTALLAKGTNAVFVPADLARVEDCRAVIGAAEITFGRLDALVNAAGLTDRGTIFDTSPELFDSIMAVNLRAPFFLTQTAAALMRRRGIRGSVINIISMSGHGGQPFITAYCASKGALITLTKNAAFGLLRHGIRVNGLCIGWMDTPGEDRIMRTYHGASEGWRAAAEAGLPTGRMLKPEEVGRAVAFLASEESGMMTGAIIDFDQSVSGCYEAPPQPAPLA
jgi:NAD(P)-dependent dehydrogenase (short-subunit alcohol dehydrogenase family)